MTHAFTSAACCLAFFLAETPGHAQSPLIELVPCVTSSSNNPCTSLNLRLRGPDGRLLKFDKVDMASVDDASPYPQTFGLPAHMLQILDREILLISDREAVYRRAFEVNGTPELSLTLKNLETGDTFDGQIRIRRNDGGRTPPVEGSGVDTQIQYLVAYQNDLGGYPLEIAPADRFKFVALATYGMYASASQNDEPTLFSYPVFAEPRAESEKIGSIEVRFSRTGRGSPEVQVAFLPETGPSAEFIPHRSTEHFSDRFAFDVTLLKQIGKWRKIALPGDGQYGWLEQSGGRSGLDPFSTEVVFGGVGAAFGLHDGYSFYGAEFLVDFSGDGSVQIKPAHFFSPKACDAAEPVIADCELADDDDWKSIPWRVLYTDDGRLIYSPTID